MRRRIIHYDPQLKERARELRNNSTLSEIFLWRVLRGKQIRGYDFHGQKPIDKYIVDFYCPDLFLAIEIDGFSHFGKGIYDVQRQRRIESLGVHFLRFTDSDVKTDLCGVVTAIEQWIDEHAKTIGDI